MSLKYVEFQYKNGDVMAYKVEHDILNKPILIKTFNSKVMGIADLSDMVFELNNGIYHTERDRNTF